MRRNRATDWDVVRSSAIAGNLEAIPSDVYVRCYNQLRRIGEDHAVPMDMVRECTVYWGGTGLGKSRKAREEAGVDLYPKNPRTKWWCGYRGQPHCIIDEFRGAIDVSYLLQWLDRYACIVERKGGSMPLSVRKFWITSNVAPQVWYPDLDTRTLEALLRRLKIVYVEKPLYEDIV